MKKITIQGNNIISNLSEDWGGINNGSSSIDVHGTNVPSKAEWGINRGEIERFIKAQFNTKAGEFYYDADTTKYLVFTDINARNLYLTNREEYADLLLGTFDAPANYTAEIHVTTPASNVILSGTKGNYIDFTFDIKSRTGSSTGESVIATYTFNNGGNIKKATQVYNAGTNVHFLVDQYLEDGTNSISVVITGRNTLVSTMASVTYNVVNLQLTSTFDFSQSIEVGNYLSIPYKLKGAGVKYLEWYVDGVDIEDGDTIADLQVDRTKNIDTTGWTAGKHNIQVRAYITNNGNNFYSKTLYFDFVVLPIGGVFQTNQTFVLLGIVINSPVTSTLSITLTQYEEFSYKVAMFDSRDRSLDLLIKDNGTQIQSISIQQKTVETLTYMPITTGIHTISFTLDEATASITATVQDSGLGIDEITEDLTLKLSAKGRSNNETNPATWTYDNVTTTFNNFLWNNKCGWYNGALIIPAGSSIDINFAPLSGTPVLNGRTIEIDFETKDIEDDTANIINLIDGTTNAGINIKPTTAKIQSSGGATINTRYRDGDRIHLTFIINRTSGDDARFIYIVNNGILERAERFAAVDNFNVSSNLHIGSTGCTIKLHTIRVYDKALTVDEAFQNYAIDSENIVEIVNRNDILNDATGLIDVDKVNAQIPVMIITGDISSILSINDKSHKNDWNTYPVNIEFRNMQNPEMNFFIDNADIRLQGTSSISYPRKNFRIYSKSKSGKYSTKLYTPTHSNEDLVANGKYSFTEKAAPVSCWCLKADYAESSGSHNTGVAKLWNTVMKNTSSNGNYILRTEAQNWAATNEYDYDVRTTIDGFPIVLFQRDNENAPLVCFGQYNFNNDKSTEDVFGFTALEKEGATPFDNSAVECWEVLDSDNSIALFTNVSDFDNDWEDAFEARYPDKNTNVTALKRVAQWLNSCYAGVDSETGETQVNVATWKAGKASYFDLNKLAAYYIYLRRFGAVDQTVKNAMFTTEDGEHWFYINYDNDTVLGIDNESRQFDTWDYDLFTKTPQGGYYYAGKGKSVLWKCFEADEDCMELARQIDALLFNAGLTYENVCNMFDNEQSSKWCERIYNENGRFKYITQALEGKNVLHMLQGSRKSHRHWWLQHRFEKLDNVFGNGTYSLRSIQARATGTVNIPQGVAYKFTPAVTTYFGYGVASTTVDPPTVRNAGTEYTATGLPQETGVGNLIYIYNANNIGAIDLSAYISALGSLDVSKAIDVYGESKLVKLVLGDGVNTNVYLTAISGLKDIVGLEELDIRGYQVITNIDFEELTNLHTLKAVGSGLTSFSPASGTTLTNIQLPSTLQTLVLDGNVITSLSVEDYTTVATSALRNVAIKNVSGAFDIKSFVTNWLANYTDAQLENFSLNLQGINWTNVSADTLIHWGNIGTKNFKGTITISSMSYAQYQSLVTLYGASAFNENAAFRIIAPQGMYFTGPTTLNYGGTGQYTCAVFPATDKEVEYLLYNGDTKIPTQWDGQGNPYATYGGVTLYESTGVVNVAVNISQDVTLNVKAHIKTTETYSSAIALTAKAATYPSSVTISGLSSIDHNATYNYTKSFDTNNFTAQVQSVAWSLTQNNACTISASDTSGATLNVTNTPSTSLEVTLTCVITFDTGVTRTGTKTITLQLTYPSSLSISGDASINDNGNFNYTKAFNTDNFTATVLSVAWSLTSNENVTISSSDNNGAVVSVPNGNDTAVTLTLTCIATLTGNVQVTGTKSISVSVIDPPTTEDWVDLGLPSGLLWCTHNIGATKESDYGKYFSWGNIVGHKSTNSSTFDDSYDFGTSNSGPYASTAGATLTGNIPANVIYDAAQAIMGGDWRMPTSAEFQELRDNTDREWTTIDGVVGYKFMKKTDHSVYVFFPAAGRGRSISVNSRGSEGYYWSSSYLNSGNAFNMLFDSSSVSPQGSSNRYIGYSIRPVMPPPIITSYRIDQTTANTDPSDVIIKTTASKDASPTTDAIAAIRANSHIYIGRYDSTNNVLNARQVNDSDKTLWTDGTSIVMGAEDDVFMKLPAFKWKCEEVSTDLYEITFAYGAVSGSGWHEWEGNTFIGVHEAYQDNNKIYSKSGVTPTTNVPWTDFTARARARYNNNNYRIVTYEAHQIMCLLGYGWLGTTDAPAVIGVGTSTCPKTTGLCNSKGMSDSVKSVDGDTTSINFWGLENWWGDLYEWIDNIKSSESYKVNILGDDRTTVVRSNIGSGNNISGEIKQLVLGTEGEVIPKLTASSSNYNKDFADYGGVGSGSGRVARRSSYAADLDGGLACLYVFNGASYARAYVGSRLLYKGNYNIVSSLS